jgi:hypothetical protein
VLFECFFATKIAIASPAMDGFRMYGRVLLVLFECFLAAETAIAEDARVVHHIDNSSFFFVQLQEEQLATMMNMNTGSAEPIFEGHV